MSKSGSHWVSARMSAALEHLFPPPPAPKDGPLGTSQIAHPVTREADEPQPASTPVPSHAAAGRDLPRREDAHPDAGDTRADGERASTPPISVVAAAALARRPEPAPPASVTPPQPPAPDETDAPMPRFLAEPSADAPSTRRPSWLVLGVAGLMAALVIGSARVGDVPDGATKMADVKAAHREAAAQSVQRPTQTLNAAKADSEVAPPPERAPESVELELGSDLPPSSMMTFRDATLCTDAACGPLLGDLPRSIAPTPIAPALGAVAGIGYADGHAGRDTTDPIEMVTVKAAARDPAQPSANAPAESGVPVALGSLGEIEIVLLPRDGRDTARAKVALRARDGRQLAELELKVDDALLVGATEAVVEEDDTPDAEARDPGPAPRAPDVAATHETPEKSARKDKAKKAPRRAKSVQSTKNASSQARPPEQQLPPAKPPPRGLFTSDSPAQPAAPPPPAPPSAKAPAPSPSDMASQPTPRTIDRSPGSETLMGLGGIFTFGQSE